MSTSADMSVANNYGSPVTCAVSGVNCMLENGAGGSHLERFNATIASGQSLSDTVATDADGACNKSQSQFTLDFADAGGESLGSVTLELGRGHFKTGVVSNTAPWAVWAATSGKGKKRHIRVGLVPQAEALVNSWLWANMLAIEGQLTLPPVSVMGFEFSSATVTGLENLTCTSATVGGTAEKGVVGKLQLEGAELFTHGKIGLPHLFKIDSGLTLESPKLTATASLQLTPELRITLDDLTIKIGGVSAKVEGVPIPSNTLTLLAKAVEAAVNHGPAHERILKDINKRLPGHKKDGEEATS